MIGPVVQEVDQSASNLSPFVSTSSVWPPRLISEHSVWNEHVPFAGWIVEATRPRVLVELGTHIGVSYFAFCESVARLNAPSLCFAVDTWLGDDHSGFYGEDVYQSVREMNSRYYGSFSKLLRTTFDEAVAEFDDSSIDLLHIDGLHTYEAVRHDFETWLPKLSERAVVLLHDTNESKRDFGVYRFLAELSDEYPIFEFTHEHGLGMVCVGTDVPTAITELVALDSAQATALRGVYEAFGRRLSAERREATNVAEVARLSGVVVERDAEVARLSGVVVERDAEVRALKVDRAKARRSFARLRNRRSIRLALALSRPFRPLFRVVRRVRKSVRGTSKTARPDFPSSPPPSEATKSERPPAAGASPPDKTSSSQVPRLLPSAGSYRETVTVIVPVYNAPVELRKCLESLVRNTSGDARLLLIDDASTDRAIAGVLSDYSELEHVAVLTNQENLGFVRTVNRGFAATTGDVVILNSDTEVTPGWLDGLRLAARLVPSAGTVTPLSDNAGAFSAPSVGTVNSLPPGLTRDEVGRLVSTSSARTYPLTPTGSGYCMFIRRSCIDDVGVFDADAFPRGYGEENDFCMRAIDAGWVNVIDDTTYVFHVRSASFGEEKHSLMTQGRAVLNDRYPHYGSRVREFMTRADTIETRDRVGQAFSSALLSAGHPRRRVLFVLHAAGGGTPATTRDLIGSLASSYECFVLVSDGKSLSVNRVDGNSNERLGHWRLVNPISVTDSASQEYERIVQSVVVDLGIDLIHIRHLIKHTFELPRIAKSLNIPVVLSFHDFYYVCPTVHLMDNDDRFCHGVCSAGQGVCPMPTRWLAGAPHLKHAWVYDWRERAGAMFDDVDYFVTASETTKQVYVDTFAQLVGKRFEVIEHGRELEISDPPIGRSPVPSQPIRILLPGNVGVHKGSAFVRRLSELDTDGRLEFHLIGNAGSDLSGVVVRHGGYERSDFALSADAIEPMFVGLFSATAESFSHVLTESWAAGIPVLASSLGALGDRIERFGGGWALDINDPVRAYERILDIAADLDGYAVERKRATEAARRSRTLEDMAMDYAAIYGMLEMERRSFTREAASAEGGSTPLRVGVFAPGITSGPVEPSSHVRVLRRFLDPSIVGSIVWKRQDAKRFIAVEDGATGIDVAFVQRTAIPPDMVSAFVQKCQSEGVGLVFDVDDDLLSIDPEWEELEHYRPLQESMEAIASVADTVSVSTPRLATVFGRVNKNVVVLSNALDRFLWFSPLSPRRDDVEMSDGIAQGDRIRILFFGGRTHGRDLELLRRPLSIARERAGALIELFVVGGTHRADYEDWYTVIEIPDGRGEYPRFVEWIRSLAGAFDFAVAPLEDTQLNESKSDLRFLEYAALGLPGVYSEGSAFSSVVDGETGLLVDNTPEAWSNAIIRFSNDRELRDRIQSTALDYVRESRLIDHQANDFVSVLRSAAALITARNSARSADLSGNRTEDHRTNA